MSWKIFWVKRLEGVLCSDFYGAYHQIECEKQKCWAHVLRDLKNHREKYPKNLEIAYFAGRLKFFFHRGKTLREELAAGKDIAARLSRLEADTTNFIFGKFRS